jgi:uncharacterized protein
MKSVADILRNSKIIAVVGLGTNQARPAYGVSQYMQRQGYRIIPVHPAHSEVLGEKVYKTLEDIPEPVDIVNVFRRSEFVPPIVDSAIKIGAQTVWLQEGIVHEDAADKARAAGLNVVVDSCIYKEHRRLR